MTWPALDLADAYAVQQDNITCRLVTGATVIGHPATAVAWPASTLAAYGAALDAEHVILPGAMATAPLIGAGQKAEARFGPLGSVSVSFV
ncbi:hypothetical protein [Streptomyces cyaneofuscatus]|uniref:hypothetical protein n=1 Tax=Streptomyces cyaneofuscatus TaxID=66883 RepID=UPI0037D47131